MPDIQTTTHEPIDIDGLPLASQPFMTGAGQTQYVNVSAGLVATVTLPATVGLTTYLLGFALVITASTALTPPTSITITGLQMGTMNWPTRAQMTGVEIETNHEFGVALPASAPNTAIVLTYPAVTNGGQVQLMAWGFQA